MDPYSDLTQIADYLDRVDAVDDDIQSGRMAFARIPAWELGELLGIEWEEAATEWSHHFLSKRSSISDWNFEFPFAENVRLLECHITPERFLELKGVADRIQSGDILEDLGLSNEEIHLLVEEFSLAEARSGASETIVLAETFITSTKGNKLHFEVIIGDGGELEDPKGPFDLLAGKLLDRSLWIEVD